MTMYKSIVNTSVLNRHQQRGAVDASNPSQGVPYRSMTRAKEIFRGHDRSAPCSCSWSMRSSLADIIGVTSVSGANARPVTPMMSAKLLRDRPEHEQGASIGSEKFFARVIGAIRNHLAMGLEAINAATLLVTVSTLV